VEYGFAASFFYFSWRRWLSVAELVRAAREPASFLRIHRDSLEGANVFL
jgi:hypothetical protein